MRESNITGARVKFCQFIFIFVIRRNIFSSQLFWTEVSHEDELFKSFRRKVQRISGIKGLSYISYSKKKKKSDLIKSSQHLDGMGMIFENSKFTKMLVLSFIEFAKLAKGLILDAVVS